MILIADSGSTKSDWIIYSAGAEVRTGTMGFNPFFHTTEIIYEAITQNTELKSIAMEVSSIFFYGAGCSSEARNAIVHKALQQSFPNAVHITVEHDQTAAALATCGDEPGIACILGTGSNSCYYDGNITSEEVPSLGYVLGDEGSGSFFGKALLKEYLYKHLPDDLYKAFDEEFKTSKEEIFRAVYHEPNPNVYLASFMRFISQRRDHPHFRERIYAGLASFANIHISCFSNYKEVPVHFVGSIAYYFREVLEEVAKNYRFTIGEIIKKPIDNLAKYHIERISKEK